MAFFITQMNNLNYSVYQVWIGGDIPFDDKRWSNSIKNVCKAQNIDYKLYTQKDLSNDKGFSMLSSHLENVQSLNEVQKNVLLSDYARFSIMCSLTGNNMYLDTDFIPTGAMPDLPENGIFYMNERWDKQLPCSGLLYYSNQDKEWLRKELDDQVERICSMNVLDPRKMMSYFGPVWYREILYRNGIHPVRLGTNICGHTRNQDNSSLLHVGRGVWIS